MFEDPAPGRFALNETAHGLLNSPVRLGLGLDGIGGRMAFAWGSLLGAVRTGAGLSRGLPPTFLEGSAGPSGSSCELRCVDGAVWARHSRPRGAGHWRLGIGTHRGRRRRGDGMAAGGNPSRPAQRAGACWSISRRPWLDPLRSFRLPAWPSVSPRWVRTSSTRCRPGPISSAEKRAGRLARSRGDGHPAALRRGGAPGRSHRRPRRGVARRGLRSVAVLADGCWWEAETGARRSSASWLAPPGWTYRPPGGNRRAAWSLSAARYPDSQCRPAAGTAQAGMECVISWFLSG